MNAAVLRSVIDGWAKPARRKLDELDRALRGRRGPKPALTLTALSITIVCLLLEQRPAHLKAAWRALDHANAECLRLLGIHKRPTYRQVCLVVERLRRHVDHDEGPARGERVRQLLDILVPASAGGDDGTTTWAVDTTLFDAWCRWVRKTDRCSDPDAAWRKIDRPGTSSKTYLGYAAVAAVRTDGTGPEVCDRLTVIPANLDDAGPAADLCLAVRDSGLRLERVVADRGFTQKPDRFQQPLRNAGVHVTFDLKSDDLGVNGTFKGAIVIDGWLYAPGIPERLHRLERPGPNAPEARHDEFTARIAERIRWAFRPHHAPAAHRCRVAPRRPRPDPLRIADGTANDRPDRADVPQEARTRRGVRNADDMLPGRRRTEDLPVAGLGNEGLEAHVRQAQRRRALLRAPAIGRVRRIPQGTLPGTRPHEGRLRHRTRRRRHQPQAPQGRLSRTKARPPQPPRHRSGLRPSARHPAAAPRVALRRKRS